MKPIERFSLRSGVFALAALSLCMANHSAQAKEVQVFTLGDFSPKTQNPTEVEIKRLTQKHQRPVTDQNQTTEYIETDIQEPELNLNIMYSNPAEAKLRNPLSPIPTGLHVRTYNGQLSSPTIRVRPGDTVRVNLDNQLCDNPKDRESCQKNEDTYDVTNLHAHGLWISPTGNSDNVLLNIKPGRQFQYEWNIPSDHPSGLFWYHPHMHGSTAIQVAGGMGGALVIKGDRVPTPEKNGDIDTILKQTNGQDLKERIVVFQQIQYGCMQNRPEDEVKADIQAAKEKGQNEPVPYQEIKTLKTADGQVIGWKCDEGDTGVIEPPLVIEGPEYDINHPVPGEIGTFFGPNTWPTANRYTTLNGIVQPHFPDATVGAVERWRVVHAGVRDTINLSFYKINEDAGPFPDASSNAQTSWIMQNCGKLQEDLDNLKTTGLQHAQTQWQYAADGLTRPHLDQLKNNTLQPGYRSEFLTVFEKPGTYCVLDTATLPEASINAERDVTLPTQLLGFVKVNKGGQEPKSDEMIIRDTLVHAAHKLPKDVRDTVIADLNQKEIRLDRFVKHHSVKETELSPEKQHLTFAIGVNDSTGAFKFMVDGNQFPDGPTRYLQLGTAEEWVLEAKNLIPGNTQPINHPFHIHVNPFEITKICAPVVDAQAVKDTACGEGFYDVTNPNIPRSDRLAWEEGDSQYLDLKGYWKDTIFVKMGYKVHIRTRYQRYIGKYVLHCHILDHEDEGMMQLVNVYLEGDAEDPKVTPHMHH